MIPKIVLENKKAEYCNGRLPVESGVLRDTTMPSMRTGSCRHQDAIERIGC